jgi:4-amino-4-deoxy-L-arabinose transferase-like glycosyltransferase
MTRAGALAARVVGWRHAPLALELLLLGIVLLDFARIVARLMALDSPLHWDEAVYAVRARSWVEPDAALSGWSYIRPPLLPMLAGLPVLAGGDEWQLRSIGLLAGVGLLLVAWWLGRMIAGPVAGLLAAAVLHGSPTLQKESATLLTDVPAAALLLCVAALLWWQLEERPSAGAGLVVAAGVAALAFLMRYGSVLALAPMLAVAGLLWWRRLATSRHATIAALAVGAAVVIAHVGWSVAQTGAPLGILVDAQNVVSEDPAGVAPSVEYQRYLPFTLAGTVGGWAMRVGSVSLVAFAIAATISPPWRRPFRAALLLVIPSGAHILLVTRGVGHAEERFFIFSAALLVVAAAVAVAALLRPFPVLVRGALLAAVAVALVLSRGEAVEHSLQRTVETGAYYTRFEAAGRTIAAVAAPDCGIVGGGDPIVAWYSGCETNRLRLPAGGGPPGQNLEAEERWAVLFGDPAEIDSADEVVTAIEGAAVGAPLRITDPATGREVAMAWRLTR